MIRHWSYSALRQYLECPLRFFFQRILMIPEKSQSANLVLGSAVHAALADYHRGLRQDQPRKTEELHRSITECWEGRESKGPITYKGNETKAECLGKAVGLIEVYVKEPPPRNIIGIEQEVQATLKNSRGEELATPLVAVLDLVTRNDEEVQVHEFKTSARAYSEFEAESSLQPTCYAAAIQHTTGALPRIRYTVLVKTKTPKVQRLETLRDTEDIGRLGDLIETVERGIEADVFYPVEDPIHCTGCSYRQPCRDWGRTMSLPLAGVPD